MKYIYALLFVFLAFQASAQDKIITVDSDTILCKIMERGTSEVSYVLFSDLSGPARSMAYTVIHQIIMQSGAVTTHAPLKMPSVPPPSGDKKKKTREKKEIHEESEGSWNRHALRLEFGVSTASALIGGFAAEGMFSYSFNMTPRKSLRLTGAAGVGYYSDYYRGWNYEGEINTVGVNLSFHYTWLNRPRLKLHSGIGVGYALYEVYGDSIIYDPSRVQSNMATFAQAKAYFSDLDYDTVLPDIELIGMDLFLGRHWLFTTRIGLGPAGLANIGIGYSF